MPKRLLASLFGYIFPFHSRSYSVPCVFVLLGRLQRLHKFLEILSNLYCTCVSSLESCDVHVISINYENLCVVHCLALAVRQNDVGLSQSSDLTQKYRTTVFTVDIYLPRNALSTSLCVNLSCAGDVFYVIMLE